MLKPLPYRFIILIVLFLNALYVPAQKVDTVSNEDGAISSTGSYDSKGRQKGHWIYYWENGSKRCEGKYVRGNYHGKWLFYDDDGELLKVGIYKKNRLIKNTLPDGSPFKNTTVEVMPEFPDGVDSLMAYLGSSITYPSDAKEAGVEGAVYVSFIVEADGSVNDINFLKSIHPSIEQEVIRVIRAMPHWHPGTQNGKPVRVQYNLPINFNIPKK